MSFFSYLGLDSALNTIIAGFAMAVNYIFCAGVLCFGNGPANYVGNYYFATWAGVFISLALFGSALKEFLKVRGSEATSSLAAIPIIQMTRWEKFRIGSCVCYLLVCQSQLAYRLAQMRMRTPRQKIRTSSAANGPKLGSAMPILVRNIIAPVALAGTKYYLTLFLCII